MSDIATIIDISRLAVGIFILLYASYTDIKTRRASNFLWIIMGLAGGILLLAQYFLIGFENILMLIFVPIMIGFVYLLFQFRLLYGGADAKALMALTILVPFFPSISNFPLFGKSAMPFPWVLLVNSLFMFLIIPISLFFYNLFHKNLKFPHAFLGYFSSIDKARTKFLWPLEIIDNGKKKLSLRPKNFDVDDEFNAFEKEGVTDIWVTPKVPFMIPLLIGFIFSFIFGDILNTIIQIIIS
jgi:preflagellin peptidase FlaK